MGLSAVFPRGSRVCVGRSGDAPRGFYARYGTAAAGCEDANRPSAYMGIGSSFNALFYDRVEEATGSCGPISTALKRRLGDESLDLPGHRSIACQRVDDEMIEIAVYALGGGNFADVPGEPPRVIYWASLGTRPDRFDRDLAMFRTFLRRARIGIPE